MKNGIKPFKYFVSYGKRNYLKNVVALFVMLFITSLFVVFTGVDWGKRFVQYRNLQTDGIEGIAFLEKVFKGGGKSGTNSVCYKFNTTTDLTVYKREKTGRVLCGQPFSSLVKGMPVTIYYLPYNPSVSLIAGNTAILRTRFYFLLFFSIAFCVVAFALAGHWVGARKLNLLESKGTKARRGEIVSVNSVLLRGNRTRIDVQYTFFDENRQKYRVTEEFWRPEAVKSLREGDAVTVMYDPDLPKKSCILL